MSPFFSKTLPPLLFLLAIAGFSINAHATDVLEGRALIEAKLEEAKKLLAEDTANHSDTAQKKAEIDQKLAAQKEREAGIKEELQLLCEEQEKLKAGSMVSCMKKINN